MKTPKSFTISAEELSHMRHQTFVWNVDLLPGCFEDEDMSVRQIDGTLTLRRQLNVIEIEGDLQVRVRLTSGRSLEQYETEFPVKFAEGLEVVEYFHFPENLEIGMEDAVDQVRPEDPIDLTELIRQHIILNLPVQNPDDEPGETICYNVDSSQPEPDEDPESGSAWAAIRKTVESWEKPSDN